jgi:hypothetical protein
VSAELIDDPHPNMKQGKTFFGLGGDWIRETGVYLAPGHNDADTEINVVLWLHGTDVPNIQDFFHSNDSKVRECVRTSGRDVILIAPHLGYAYKDKAGKWHGKLSAGKLAEADGGEKYLKQVFGALRRKLGTTGKFLVNKLIVAAHSGGGRIMRAEVVPNLGKMTADECWGFDCLYNPAGDWNTFVRTAQVPCFFYFGTGTQPDYGGCPTEFWKLALGTPGSPNPAGGVAANVSLAPALPGVEDDTVAFESLNDIKRKSHLAPYERLRKEADALLDHRARYWSFLFRKHLRGHYPVATDLFPVRLKNTKF